MLKKQILMAEGTLFGSGNKKQKLEKNYRKLMEEAYQLSKTDRAKGDQKTAEAEQVRKQIEALENASG